MNNQELLYQLNEYIEPYLTDKSTSILEKDKEKILDILHKLTTPPKKVTFPSKKK